jgi:hypothetical protein
MPYVPATFSIQVPLLRVQSTILCIVKHLRGLWAGNETRPEDGFPPGCGGSHRRGRSRGHLGCPGLRLIR